MKLALAVGVEVSTSSHHLQEATGGLRWLRKPRSGQASGPTFMGGDRDRKSHFAFFRWLLRERVIATPGWPLKVLQGTAGCGIGVVHTTRIFSERALLPGAASAT